MSAPRPTPEVPRPYRFPAAVERRLSSGLTVIAVPMHRLPAVSLLFVADAGAERETAAHAGAGLLAAQALGEGTRRLPANALAAAFERLGGELECNAGWTHAEAGTTVLQDGAPGAMSLLAEVVREPLLPDEGIQRLRHERLAELLQQRAEPRGLADDLFAQCCHAVGDRNGLPSGGSEKTVGECNPELVRQHHAEFYSPESALLVVVGDVTADEAHRLGESALGGWHGRGSRATMGLATTPRVARGVHVGHRQEAPQSEIRVGHASVPRTHPDFHALTVMNAILGGLFSSRINLNLRERHGYTYGAFSSFDWRRGGSVFEVSTAVRSDVTGPAVREILGEIDRIRAERVEEGELSLARDFLTGVFPLRFETTAAIADAVAFRWIAGLSPSYHDEYRARIGAVTLDDVHRVAVEHLRPEHLQVVVVGDAGQVTEPLQALEFGDVQRLEVSGSDVAPGE